MSALRNSLRWIFQGALCLLLVGPAAEGTEQETTPQSIESARIVVLRLREERAQLRDGLDAPREELLADATGYIAIAAEYRVSSEGSRDVDTYLWIWTEVGDDSKDPVTAGLSGRLNWDLNGHDHRNGMISAEDSLYADYGALENERLTDQIYTAFVDFNRVGPLEKVRAGRQYQDGYAGGHFDGAQIYMKPGEDSSLRLYGGVPVNFYRLTGEDPYSTDHLYGGAFTHRWDKKLSMTVEVQEARDQKKYFGTRKDYQVVLALRYDILDNLRASVVENVVSGQQRELRANLDYWNLDHDLNCALDYVWMSEHFRDLTDQYTPYTDIMGTFEPYQLFRVMAAKGLGDHFEIGGDVAWRELVDSSDETLYNQEYTRSQVSLTVIDLPVEDFSATIHYEYWNAKDDDEVALGGEVRQRLDGSHVLEGGSYYSKFKYREFTLIDTINVQTYFLRWRWALARNIRIHVKGEVEAGEDYTSNTLSTGIEWRF
ncbi:MAG: hypothetical protein ACYTG7_04815 [Planctomycetota bacterium]